ncbi:MAG: hypothetical protein CSA38_04810 [Flavobacteriales bacterium]|nr:MAG: hypothetical protein CSA38_04810 [Flavobacteriales bacterium]
MFRSNKKQKTNKLDSQKISTVIGVDVLFKGDITGKSAIRVDGVLQGNIEVENGLVLGEKGKVKGNINTSYIVVYGTVEGNITCKELILKNTGVVHGDISTHTVEIEMGGKYNGQLVMNTPSVTPKK